MRDAKTVVSGFSGFEGGVFLNAREFAPAILWTLMIFRGSNPLNPLDWIAAEARGAEVVR